MITDHHAFELAGRKTFERVMGQPPLRVPIVMPNEVCFYYIVEGDSRTYTPRERSNSRPARVTRLVQNADERLARS